MGFHWLSTGLAGAFQAALLAAAAGFLLALATHALAPRLAWRTGSALGVATALGLLVGAGVDAWHLFHLSIVRLESPFAIRETLARIHDPGSLGLRVGLELVGACTGALAGWGVWDLFTRRRRQAELHAPPRPAVMTGCAFTTWSLSDMAIPRMQDLDLAGRRVLIREDLNVPLDEAGEVASDLRIRAALPTLQAALEQGAAVMVLSHLGRPTEGEWSARDSLAPVARRLSALLGREVPLVREYLDGVELQPGDIVLLENCRMNVGEKADDAALARRYAALCDVFVMDAFGTAHRAQASTHGVIRAARAAAGGPLLMAELDALGRALKEPARPLLAIVAGSKVSTKLALLEQLAGRVDQLIVGGGIANTFIAAAGHAVGTSLQEAELIPVARRIMEAARARGGEVPVPVDVVVAPRFAADAPATVKRVEDVGAGEMILDIGPDTAADYARRIAAAGTVVWNGPVGVFEFDAFGGGTEALARAIAGASAFSIAGGGDTLAAIEKYGVREGVSYISTGGGAFLEFLEGKVLPAVAALEARA